MLIVVNLIQLIFKGFFWFTLIGVLFFGVFEYTPIYKSIISFAKTARKTFNRVIDALVDEPAEEKKQEINTAYLIAFEEEKESNKKLLISWLKQQRANGHIVSAKFLAGKTDCIDLKYDKKAYIALLKINTKGGQRYIEKIICKNPVTGECEELEGYKFYKPQLDAAMILSSDDAIRYLNSVKENMLDNHLDGEIDLERLTGSILSETEKDKVIEELTKQFVSVQIGSRSNTLTVSGVVLPEIN